MAASGTDDVRSRARSSRCCAARRSGNPLQPGGGSSVWLPSVYCMVGYRRRSLVFCFAVWSPAVVDAADHWRDKDTSPRAKPRPYGRTPGRARWRAEPGNGAEDTDKLGSRGKEARPPDRARRPDRPGHRSGGLHLGLGAGDELVVGVEDGLAAGPVARPCPRPPGGLRAGSPGSAGGPGTPGAASRSRRPARTRGWRSRPGAGPAPTDPSGHPDPLSATGRRRSGWCPGPARRTPCGRQGPCRRLPVGGPVGGPGRPWAGRPRPPRRPCAAIRDGGRTSPRSAGRGRRSR